jgi:hypothetical protein
LKRLLLDALNLQAHYMVAREIAATYVEVSKRHILQGVQFIERIGLTQLAEGGNTAQTKVEQITRYARNAQRDISLLAEKVRDQRIHMGEFAQCADFI